MGNYIEPFPWVCTRGSSRILVQPEPGEFVIAKALGCPWPLAFARQSFRLQNSC